MKAITRAVHHFTLLFLFVAMPSLGQTSSTSGWEPIGPAGAGLADLIRFPETGTLLAATNAGPSQIYKSTDDGSTWTWFSEVKTPDGWYCAFASLVYNPRDTNEIVGFPTGPVWAWPKDRSMDTNCCFFARSTDGGKSWERHKFRGEFGWSYTPARMRVDASGAITIAGYGVNELDATLGRQPFIARSTDGGKAWSFRRYPNSLIGETIIYAVTVDPSDSNIVYVGGTLSHGDGSAEPVLLKTTNNGVTWSSLLMFQGTTVYDVRCHPQTPSTIYVATDAVTFVSTDRGISWNPKVAGWLSRPARDIGLDPTNSSVVYAYNYRERVTRSTDGGSTWTVLGTVALGSSVSKIIIHPAKGYKLYAATAEGCFKSENAGQNWYPGNGGLYSAEIRAIRCVPDNPQVVYLSKFGTGILRTANATAPVGKGGLTWERLPNFLTADNIDHIAVTGGTSPTIYTLQSDNGGANVVTKSTDGGYMWHEIDRTIASFDINCTRSLYLAGAGVFQSEPVKRMALRWSSDDGRTWQQSTILDSLSVANAVLPDPVNDSIIYVGGLQFFPQHVRIMKTTDKGAHWKAMDANYPQPTSWVVALVSDKAHPNRIIAGSAGEICRSTDAGETWSMVRSLTSLTCIVNDKSNPDLMYAGCHTGVIVRSTDGGATWNDFSEGIRGLDITSMDLDSQNQVLYAGTRTNGAFRRQLPISAGGGAVTHRVALPPGWNMISSYVMPKDSTIDSVMVHLHTKPLVMKNGAGQVYWPALGINTIGKWNYRSGYQLFMNAPDTIVMTGPEVAPQSTPIPLTKGWSMISYLRNSPMRADSVFGILQDAGVVVKDNAGEVYWAGMGFNTLFTAKPGQGYWINVRSDVTFTYSQNAWPAPADQVSKRGTTSLAANGNTIHYTPPSTSTGSNALLVVRGDELREGDEIAVRTRSGLIAGSGRVSNGSALVTIWGDDPTTENIDGAIAEEPLTLVCWSVARGSERIPQVQTVVDGLGTQEQRALRYSKDAALIMTIAGEETALPQNFELGQNYPNPFNPSTSITFALPVASSVSLKIFDVLGKEVATLVQESRQPGIYTERWDASAMSSGIYFYQLRAGNNIAIRKMLLLK
ncbi:MAG: T9SS type A sorting domain-containing protein [Ignavibacteriales bacterium]|nr:T9SS type A sorting domain-containing protein [Ignavibacteriales bacterium]